MAAGPGTLSKWAFKKGATWGTAVALGTGNNRGPIKSSTLKARQERVPDDSIVGTATRAKPSLGNLVVDGSTVHVADYRQNLVQLATFMGTAGAPTLVETGVYKHVLPFTTDVTGKFGTGGIDFGGKKVHVFKSIKALRYLFQSRAGGYAEETFDWLGRGLDDGQASSWTYENDPSGSGGRNLVHRSAVVRVNAAGGGALGSSDKVYPVGLQLEVNRALAQDYAQQGDSEEPIPGDFAEISLALDFYGGDTALYTLFREAHEDGTSLKADIVYTHGVLLGATKYRERSFYLPNLEVVECPTDLPGPGPVPFTVRMTAHKASSLPTGFPTGYDEELTIEAQNEISADLLA